MSAFGNIVSYSILNEEFLLPEGTKTKQTAKIIYTKDDSTQRETKIAYISENDIFELIDNQEKINLNNCFIDNFSISRYRQLRNLEKKEPVRINQLSANNTVFLSEFPIDFSYSIFLNGNISIEEASFCKGELNFHASEFGNGNVSFANTWFNCNRVDFANCQFGDGTVNFKNTTFRDGFKDFQYCKFGNGEIIFTNSDFGNGDVSFINSIFGNCDISFKVARFGKGKVDFHYARFESGDISFERTDFGSGTVDFRKVEWLNNRINFNRSVFGICEIAFEESELKQGKFNFKKAKIEAGVLDFSAAMFSNIEIYFDGTAFGNSSLHFTNSQIGHLSLRGCHIDNYADLRLSFSNHLDMSDTIIRDIVDMKPVDFNVNISTLSFEGMRLIGRIYIGWNENKVLSLISNQKNTSLHSKAEQFRILKQNFNQTGQYDDEDNAYVYFKRFEAKARLKSQIIKNKLNALFAYPEFFFKWLVFDKVGLYATSPSRVLVSIIITFFIFGILLFLGQISLLGNITSSVGNPDHLSVFSQSLYHSAITFFTIGYGDTYPQGIDRVLSALEGFTGVFMMSYFTVAFVRKILR